MSAGAFWFGDSLPPHAHSYTPATTASAVARTERERRAIEAFPIAPKLGTTLESRATWRYRTSMASSGNTPR
jgi:hypothetical protein